MKVKFNQSYILKDGGHLNQVQLCCDVKRQEVHVRCTTTGAKKANGKLAKQSKLQDGGTQHLIRKPWFICKYDPFVKCAGVLVMNIFKL